MRQDYNLDQNKIADLSPLPGDKHQYLGHLSESELEMARGMGVRPGTVRHRAALSLEA